MTAPATNGDRPRCHCGFVLIPTPGRSELCCPVHMPTLRQAWRRQRPRRRVVRRCRPVAVVPLAPRLVEVEVMIDDLETGQLGMVEA